MTPARPKKSIPDYFEKVVADASRQIPELTADENMRRFYQGLITGGSVAAKAVVNDCQGLKEVWAGGSEKKALALIRLFTLVMLSQCNRWLGNEPPSSDQQTRALQAAANIGHLLGDNSRAAQEFTEIDVQFKYDLENKDHLVHLGSLLLAKASDACGHKSIDWSKVSFPVKSMKPVTSSGAIVDSAPIRDPNDIRALLNSHAAGVQAMNNYYQGSG